jgi:hypothetical protein
MQNVIMHNQLTLLFCAFSLFINAQNQIDIGPNSSNTAVTLLTPNHIVPYNCFNNSGHVQYVYTASELIANGAAGAGNIDSLGWDVVTQITSPLPDYTIKLKNISAVDVSAYDSIGLNTVFNAHTINASTGAGWRMFGFDSLFYWDGQSNILVDVCWNKIGITASTGSIYHFGTSGVTNERLYIKSQTVDMCGIAPNTMATFKPFIRFNFCVVNCGTTTAINDEKQSNKLVFENVVTDHLYLTMKNTEAYLHVFDMLGKQYTLMLNGNKFNTNALCPGIYSFNYENKSYKFIKLGY